MEDNLLRYKIALSLIPGVGSKIAKNIIAYTGSLEGVFKEKKSVLLKIPGVGEQTARNIKNLSVTEKVDNELEFIQKNNLSTYFYLDDNYPSRLKQCPDSPIMLYAKGDPDFNRQKVIAIVGTRQATEYGKNICEELIKDLAAKNHDALIVSGLAYGIDIAAHKAALKNNLDTVAILAHGLDNLYPSLHKNIANEIVENGALLTEFLSGSKIDRNNFLKRNRIVAGLSDATIIIESAAKGGALVTGDIANSYNRDVFAFPGRMNDTYSKGCNDLIKTHKAGLIESAEDLEYFMGWDAVKENTPKQMRIFPDLSPVEQQIVDLLQDHGKLEIDIIGLKTKLPINTIASQLLQMEFAGIIKCLPGKIYALI